MARKIALISALLVVAVLLAGSTRPTDAKSGGGMRTITQYLPSFSFSLPWLTSSDYNTALTDEAWGVFERYIAFAKARDLDGVRSLSHTTSEACADPARQEECMGLVDSVAAVGSLFKREDFKKTVSSNMEVLIHTDGPEIVILHFIRNDEGELKVAGIRTCKEIVSGDCAESISLSSD